MLALLYNRSGSSQGNDLYKLCKAPWPSGSGEEDFKGFAVYSHGGYLGHVAWTIYTNFGSPS